MQVEVEPEIVKSGFVFRWLMQSLELIIRTPLIWIFLIFSLSLSSLLPINIFFKSFVGLWFFLFGIELLAYSDEKKMSVVGIIRILINSVDGFLLQIYFKLIFYCFAFILFSILSIYVIPKLNVIKVNLVSDVFWMYALGFMSISGFGFQMFTHLFSKTFNSINKRSVVYNCRLAYKINGGSSFLFIVGVLIGFFLISVYFPILVLMLYPITCSILYISFREIFLGKNMNGIQVEGKEKINSFRLN
ncbi:hypothetical protein GW796_06925 [archaeon]|nr:hypothetical protein [archaeon]